MACFIHRSVARQPDAAILPELPNNYATAHIGELNFMKPLFLLSKQTLIINSKSNYNRIRKIQGFMQLSGGWLGRRWLYGSPGSKRRSNKKVIA